MSPRLTVSLPPRECFRPKTGFESIMPPLMPMLVSRSKKRKKKRTQKEKKRLVRQQKRRERERESEDDDKRSMDDWPIVKKVGELGGDGARDRLLDRVRNDDDFVPSADKATAKWS